MRMHLLSLRYRRGVRNERRCRVFARRWRLNRSCRSGLLYGGESGTLRLQSVHRGAGDLLISGHLVVVRTRMRLRVVLKGTRASGRLGRHRSRRYRRGWLVLDRHLTLTLENVLTCRFNRKHRLIHIEKCGGRGAKSLVQSRTERSTNLFLEDCTGQLIRHLNDETRRTHQTLRLRKIHETTLTCRHRRISGKNRDQMRPARLKGVGHGILYFHSM